MSFDLLADPRDRLSVVIDQLQVVLSLQFFGNLNVSDESVEVLIREVVDVELFGDFVEFGFGASDVDTEVVEAP